MKTGRSVFFLLATTTVVGVGVGAMVSENRLLRHVVHVSVGLAVAITAVGAIYGPEQKRPFRIGFLVFFGLYAIFRAVDEWPFGLHLFGYWGYQHLVHLLPQSIYEYDASGKVVSVHGQRLEAFRMLFTCYEAIALGLIGGWIAQRTALSSRARQLADP